MISGQINPQEGVELYFRDITGIQFSHNDVETYTAPDEEKHEHILEKIKKGTYTPVTLEKFLEKYDNAIKITNDKLKKDETK